jgi:PHD/YefM family antitoxin component YafN of YafNO toxin-antitoxin module
MKSFPSSAIQSTSAFILDCAQNEIVQITRHRQPAAYLVSAEHFDRYLRTAADVAGLLSDGIENIGRWNSAR